MLFYKLTWIAVVGATSSRPGRLVGRWAADALKWLLQLLSYLNVPGFNCKTGFAMSESYHLSQCQSKHKSIQRAIMGVLLLLSLLLAACAPDTGLLGGGTWQATGLQHRHIRALEVDPQNPQQLYAGDSADGVFVSHDAGAHWTLQATGLPLPDAVQMLAFDPTGKKLYAATAKGLFVSINAAQQWQAVNTGSTKLPADSYTALAFDTNNPQVIYTSTTQHGVWVSKDGGVTWAQMGTGLPVGEAVTQLALDPVSHQLWATTLSGIYRIDEQRTTWQAFTSGIPADTSIYTVVPAAASGGAQSLIYAGTNAGLFLSHDDGVHWTANQELTHVQIYVVLPDFRSTNATTVYIGTALGAFRSDDSGQNWRGIATGLPKATPVYALLIGGVNNSQLYAAADMLYLFPGTSGGLSPSNLLPLLFIGVLFFLLYRTTLKRRGGRSSMKRPETTEMLPPSSTPLS
jgi:hypothetical protein